MINDNNAFQLKTTFRFTNRCIGSHAVECPHGEGEAGHKWAPCGRGV